jgi:hypothetical protein
VFEKIDKFQYHIHVKQRCNSGTTRSEYKLGLQLKCRFQYQRYSKSVKSSLRITWRCKRQNQFNTTDDVTWSMSHVFLHRIGKRRHYFRGPYNCLCRKIARENLFNEKILGFNIILEADFTYREPKYLYINVIWLICRLMIMPLQFFSLGTTAPVGLGLPPWNSPFHFVFFQS